MQLWCLPRGLPGFLQAVRAPMCVDSMYLEHKHMRCIILETQPLFSLASRSSKEQDCKHFPNAV